LRINNTCHTYLRLYIYTKWSKCLTMSAAVRNSRFPMDFDGYRVAIR
jgi:hypothetical protein